MKKLINIDSPVRDFEGEVIMDSEGKPFTYKLLFLQHLGGHITTEPKENILAYKIGMDIHAANGSVELEDAEFDLLRKTLSRPKPMYSALVMGQVYEVLDKVTDKKK